MEEGLPPNPELSDEPPLHPRLSPANYEPVFRPRPFSFHKCSIQRDWSSRSLSIESETYIVQIPKEQIFSIPPPENSIIADRYRNPETKDSPHQSRLLCAIISLIVLASIIGLIVGIIQFFFHPEAPAFSIVQIHVRNPSSSSHKNIHTQYEITLKAKNKNERMENVYSSDGEATLLYNGHKIGGGKSPEFDQAAGSSMKIGLGIRGSSSNGALPHDIERSIGDKKGKQHVALVLKMDIPVKMKLWSKIINVFCNFKVSSLGGTGQNVLSQSCQTKFK